MLDKPRKIPGWKHVLTYGNELDVYGRGNKRKAIDRKTGETFLEYNFKERKGLDNENRQSHQDPYRVALA